MNPPILEFFGHYRFLSNFWPCQVLYEGILYPSVEHAYQAAKSDCQQIRLNIASCATTAAAKRCGRTVTPRAGWTGMKVGVMRDLLRLKFADEYLRNRLLATGDAEIVEGNNWHDSFWGRCNCAIHEGTGTNWLGKLLMEIRKEWQPKQENTCATDL